MTKAALALLASLSLAATPAQNSAPSPSNAQLKADVERRLADVRPRLSLKVAAAAGTVTLTGKVSSVGEKMDAVDAARKAAGLKFVVTEIEIARADSDRVLAFEVGESLRRSPLYTVFDDLSGGVADGTVTLRGRVIWATQIEQLVKAVAHIRGVQDIKNEVRIMSPSQLDDNLRLRVANAIYGDPMFLNLSMQTMPPVHVIVENGRVTLTGRVHTEFESKRAETLAAQLAGPARVENKLLVDK